MIEISVIAPLFNEEESVELLYQKIKEAVAPLGRGIGIINHLFDLAEKYLTRNS